MRKNINLPTNESFFGRYAHLLPTLKASSTIAQIISAMTEIGVIWTIIYAKVSTVLPQFAFWFACIGAILGTAFLELGLRKFVPFSVNAVLYKRFRGLDFVMTFFIFLTTFLLIFASGTLSFNGAKEIVDNLSDPPTLLSTDGIEGKRSSRLGEINSTYQSDVNATKSRFDSQISALSSSFDAKIAKQKERLRKYENKEKNTGLSYRSTKDRINAEIANLRAQRADQSAALETKKGGILSDLLSSKSSALNSLEGKYSKDIEDVKGKNKKAVEKSENKIANYGLGLGAFTIFCLIVFLLMAIIIEVIKKGSGMEEKAVPTQFDFEDGVLASAWQAISERTETFFRTIIQNFANRTAAPPKPVKPPIVFDKSDAEKQVVKVEFEKPNEQPKITFPPISENMYPSKNSGSRPRRKVGFDFGVKKKSKI